MTGFVGSMQDTAVTVRAVPYQTGKCFSCACYRIICLFCPLDLHTSKMDEVNFMKKENFKSILILYPKDLHTLEGLESPFSLCPPFQLRRCRREFVACWDVPSQSLCGRWHFQTLSFTSAPFPSGLVRPPCTSAVLCRMSLQERLGNEWAASYFNLQFFASVYPIILINHINMQVCTLSNTDCV